jgi:probable phosphoglycerate mutase
MRSEAEGDGTHRDPGRASDAVPTHPARAALVLVRHGASIWSSEGRFQGSSDPPLSDLGERQAAALGDRLSATDQRVSLGLPGGPPATIRHSPLARAATTARILAGALGDRVPLIADSDLRELGHGSWEGSTHEDVRERFPNEYAAWRADPSRAQAPAGEPMAVAAERAALASTRALTDLRGGPGSLDDAWTILVAHDGILRLLLLRALGLGPMGAGFRAFPFHLCAITVLELGEGTIALRCHNVGDHLVVR